MQTAQTQSDWKTYLNYAIVKMLEKNPMNMALNIQIEKAFLHYNKNIVNQYELNQDKLRNALLGLLMSGDLDVVIIDNVVKVWIKQSLNNGKFSIPCVEYGDIEAIDDSKLSCNRSQDEESLRNKIRETLISETGEFYVWRFKNVDFNLPERLKGIKPIKELKGQHSTDEHSEFISSSIRAENGICHVGSYLLDSSTLRKDENLMKILCEWLKTELEHNRYINVKLFWLLPTAKSKFPL